jgi:hypothetical protein
MFCVPAFPALCLRVGGGACLVLAAANNFLAKNNKSPNTPLW